MIIEIRGISFPNKGSHLMLLSIISKLRRFYPDAQLTMSPGRRPGHRDFQDISGAGLLPKLDLSFRSFDFGHSGRFIPKRVREMYGLVLDREVDVVLDASGFAYSDQWGAAKTKELAVAARSWASRGTKVILMPQAFGPFESPGMKRLVESIVRNSSLVMARDNTSATYLREAVGESWPITKYPDFTMLLEGILPAGMEEKQKGVCIVPNARMRDKVDAGAAESYLPFLIRIAKILEAEKASPFLLVHEGLADRVLAEEVVGAVEGLQITTESDPLKIKGILGASTAVIGSRFHALVNALSQGVPAMATSWSHKYSELLEDYGFHDGLLDVRASDSEIRKKMGLLLDEDTRLETSRRILGRSEALKTRANAMWDCVRDVIES